MYKNKSTRQLVMLAIFSAIIVLLSYTPLGYIPINPLLRLTIIHVPVIIGAIVLGPAAGGFLGFVFGVTSLLKNTFEPTVVSFVFSPFYSGGNFGSIVICFIPRILIGVFAGLVFKAMCGSSKTRLIAPAVAGITGSLTNTFLVMSGIYLFFGSEYAAARGQVLGSIYSFVGAVVFANGIPEAIVAMILASAIAKPLIILNSRR